jgi:hypothetical protein
MDHLKLPWQQTKNTNSSPAICADKEDLRQVHVQAVATTNVAFWPILLQKSFCRRCKIIEGRWRVIRVMI